MPVAYPSSFLQTPFWAEFKAAHGWKPLYFSLDNIQGRNGEQYGIPLTVLLRRFSRFASIAYLPMAPDIACSDPEEQGAILAELADLLKAFLPSNTFCIRFDPPWGTDVPNQDNSIIPEATAPKNLFPPVPGRPARPAPAHIQPPDTVVLDLTQSAETLLAEMKSKWRYNIKLGEKKGVTIRFLEGEKGATEGIDVFFGLYLDTASRDGIAVHTKTYYADLLRRAEGRLKPSGGNPPLTVRVYIAEHEGQPLASIVTLFCGDEAVYLYGASSNEKRNLMPAYALQWQAIRDAKQAGCRRYDFYGIPPTDNPSHPMYGLYRFKTGFGGSIIHRVGSLDIPLRPAFYALYSLAEAGRAYWYKKVLKLFRRETRPKS